MKTLLVTKFQTRWFILLLSICLLFSCKNDELDIQQNFPFEVIVLPVNKAIAVGHTEAISMKIKNTGSFSGVQYFFRYFQYDGNGNLNYEIGKTGKKAFLPNKIYFLSDAKSSEITFYYTSQSNLQQSFDIWILDNFGNERQLSFQFNSIK
ncbi:conjugal transfer protein TraQ [Chryseobacterium elymi]|uniref:Conjugal transfer protein TraQ n=1 Tax=Chryseobacterium elymi TaxID=395936 RepID=A0A3D9DN86_9FLAO|nr:TraQ conjugal transfer family protein [Chryseobacterium elymi]REC79474.1 conjugal transfer protein TraQ [Chryseobacterium elymi]